MAAGKSIDYLQIDFHSPKLAQANKIVERDLPVIANKFELSVDSFTSAFQNGDVLIGIYNTPCGKPCIFIEYNEAQLIAPLRELH